MRKLNTEEVIKRIKQVHGDKYDYSKIEYKGSTVPLTLICPRHGEFKMKLGNITHGKQGCPKCGLLKRADGRRKTKEDFIQEAKKVHGDKFDYSKVKYENTDKKVCIICPIHGEFWQTPYKHINGNGCPKCYGLNKTTEDFIQEAKKVHGDKFDYSKAEYRGALDKICIICPIHGDFWQNPNSHLKGCGCPKCYGLNKTTEEWIQEAKKVHGDKFDYSKTEYINNDTKVCIICPTHGEFWQNPHGHLSGSGCNKCRKDKLNEMIKNSIEERKNNFISKLIEKFGSDRFTYDKVDYKNNHTLVCITCNKHGDFLATPNHLLSKFRTCCPKCRESYIETMVRINLEKEGIEYVYDRTMDFLGLQRLDFYLPHYNVAIECQGLQHFIPIKKFKKKKFRLTYEEQKEKDIMKYNKCKDNNINILYFTVPEYMIHEHTCEIYKNNLYSDIGMLLNKIKSEEK